MTSITATDTNPTPSNAQNWLQAPGVWVEEPNQRRGGFSGVQRLFPVQGRILYRKQQVGHSFRSLRHPLGAPTVMREKRALEAFARLGVRVPEIVYCGVVEDAGRQVAVLVTAELDGFRCMDDWSDSGDLAALPEERRRALFEQLGGLLWRLHQARWQHGCLYPKHIFLRLSESQGIELALLDLEKSRQRLLRSQAARHDLSQLRRHAFSWGEQEWQWIDQGYHG